MELKKKFIISLIAVLGVSTVLVYALIGISFFRKNFFVPKVQASPGSACTVSDDLIITGSVGIGTSPSYKLDVAGDTRISGNRIRFTGTDGSTYSWITRSTDDSQTLIGWNANRDTVIPNNLSVGGNITSGGKYATVGEENLRIVRGSVTDTGVIRWGSGFSVTRNGAGDYTITYNTAFGSTPSVIVSARSRYVYALVDTASEGPTSTRILTEEEGGTRTSKSFDFIAVGPR